MLVLFSAASAARDRDNFGMRKQRYFEQAPQLVGFRQRRARQGDRADRERAFVEFRKKGAAKKRQRRERQHQRRQGWQSETPRVDQCAPQPSRIMTLQPTGQPRLAP